MLLSLSMAIVVMTASPVAAQRNAELVPLPKVTNIRGDLRIGQIVIVEVQNLAGWSLTNDPSKLVLFLNGRPLKTTYPEAIDLAKNQLRFRLARNEASTGTWSNLFHEAAMTKGVTLSVGLESQTPFATAFDEDNSVSLTIVSTRLGAILLAIVLGVVALFTYLTFATPLVREGNRQLLPKQRRYDLGRFIALFWFLLISTSYFCIWLITSDSNFPPSALALPGFSSVVALVDHFRTKAADACSTPEQRPGNFSVNLFADLISDPTGYRFHRFQLLLWNLLIGAIYVVVVIKHLSLPNLGAGVVMMLGMSASIHLGFSLIETIRISPRFVE